MLKTFICNLALRAMKFCGVKALPLGPESAAVVFSDTTEMKCFFPISMEEGGIAPPNTVLNTILAIACYHIMSDETGKMTFREGVAKATEETHLKDLGAALLAEFDKVTSE